VNPGTPVSSDFREFVAGLTAPIGNQYPRPWTTLAAEPERARVFIVGANQATAFERNLCTHDEFVDSLFDRGLAARLYARARGGGTSPPSLARRNIQMLAELLDSHGVPALETNVVCYATPMSSDLRRPEHRAGAERGAEVFRALLERVRPDALLVHGEGVRKQLSRSLGTTLPEPARAAADEPAKKRVAGDWDLDVYVIQSLAPPAWNRWSGWAPEHLARLAGEVART
jgi:hypothetical protein